MKNKKFIGLKTNVLSKAVYIIFSSILLIAWIQPNPKVRVFMMGDSTMANKKASDAPETGWGQVLDEYFTNQVEIHNHAVNGRSTKSFRDRGHWKELKNQLKKDDYVILQFGHNDAKEDDTTRYAPAKSAYKQNLINYINEIKEIGVIPILATPVYRRNFDSSGKLVDGHGDYPSVVREIAKSMHIDLLDMHQASQKILEEHGPELSKHLFMQFKGNIFDKFPDGVNDNTHFSPYGARCIAAAAAQELMNQKHPLRNFLKKSFNSNKYTFELPNVATPYFRRDTFDIKKYGAISSAVINNTKSIQSAIDNAANLGGGVVLIPTGFWISGPLVLKDGINLHLADGAMLQFSNNRDDYPIVETTWEGQDAYRCQAPISGKNCTNMAITGNGTIDGAGHVWKSVKKDKLTEGEWKRLIKSGGVNDGKTWYPSEASKVGWESDWAKKITPGKSLEDYKSVRDFLRPNMISFISCDLVLIEDVTLLNSPAWTIHPLMCNHTTVSHVTVNNPWYGQNNDAIDLESCRYGKLDNCYFDTGDDAITLKSGRDEDGRRRNIPTEHWIITNTKVIHGHGGFVIGSEMSGGVNHIYVDNCTFKGTDIGLRFKTTRGRGGLVSDIYISNINMAGIVGEAILFNMFYAAKDPIALPGEERKKEAYAPMPFSETTPVFKDFYLENIHCNGAERSLGISGLPESNLENVQIKNSSLNTTKGIDINEANGIKFTNVKFVHAEGDLFNLFNAQNIGFENCEFDTSLAQPIGIVSGEKSKKIMYKKCGDHLNKSMIHIDKNLSSSTVSISK